MGSDIKRRGMQIQCIRAGVFVLEYEQFPRGKIFGGEEGGVMAEYVQYYKQFEALIETLGKFDARYGKVPWTRQKEILGLARELARFAQGQFLFFYHGFSETQPDGYPKLSPRVSAENDEVKFPPEHVLATILAQISADLAAIQAAAEQRILHYKMFEENQKRPSPFKHGHGDFFADMDHFVSGSVWHAESITSQIREPIIVVTYLTENVRVRVVPYLPVVFVGIPSTFTSNTRALFAIPHEVGHFRFWEPFEQNAAQLETRGKEWMRWEHRWLNVRELFFPFSYDPSPGEPPWAEEIFADVYGVLFGGPRYIGTAMDMALEHSTRAFLDLAFDDPHPMPLIRPLLMIKAIYALSSQPAPDKMPLLNVPNAETIAEDLFRTWEQRLSDHTRLNARTQVENIIITWDARTLNAKLPVEKLVLQAVEALRYAFRDTPPTQVPWGWADDIEATIAEWNVFFQVAEIMSVTPILLHASTTGQSSLESFKQHTKTTNSTESPLDTLKDWAIQKKGYFKSIPTEEIYAGDFETVMNPTTRPSNTWLPVFGAGGWTTEGPCTVPPG